jgi:FkbM family methyltransferase
MKLPVKPRNRKNSRCNLLFAWNLRGDGLDQHYRAAESHPSEDRKFRLNQIFRQFFSDGQLVFDIGANDGQFSEKLLNWGARVVAVEPQAMCVEQMKARIGGHRALFIENCAVGATEGSVEMFIASTGSQISSGSRDWIDSVKNTGRFKGTDWTQSITVPMTSLDALIARHGQPVFCKIDVEGFEPDVLSGLSQAISTISFEYTPEHAGAVASCVRKIATLGSYRFNFAGHGWETMYWPEWLKPEESILALKAPEDEELRKGGDVYARRD